MRLALGLALLAVCGAVRAGPQDVVARCVRNPPPSAGLAAFEAHCPDLRQALDELGVRELLSAETRDSLTSRSLSQVTSLMESPVRARPVAPDPASVAAIVRDLGAQPAPQGWWQRLKAWILARLASPAGPGSHSWLQKWLTRLTLPEALLGAIFVALVVAVVAGALAIVVGELRAAGVLDSRKRLRAATGAADIAVPPASPLSLADVQAAPPGERARLLLRLIVDVLLKSGRLRGARSLTPRELAERAELDADARQRFARLAAVAERQTFGSREDPAAVPDAVLADGVGLYAALGAEPGGGT